MEIEFIKEQVKVTPYENKRHKYANAIKKWEATDNKTLRFACKNEREKNTCYFCVKQYIKRNRKDWTVFMKPLDVYVVRA